MNYIVFDLEWNQPFTKEEMITEPIKLSGEIIQIGAVKLDEKCNVLGTLDIMVQPVHYTKMNTKVQKLTGIDNDDISHGIPFADAYRQFMDFCGDSFCFMTWGSDDIRIISANMAMHGISKERFPEYFNLQRIYGKQIAKTKKQISLEDAIEALGEPSYCAHNALNDAVSAARVCKHLDIEQERAEAKRQKKPSLLSNQLRSKRKHGRLRKGSNQKASHKTESKETQM